VDIYVRFEYTQHCKHSEDCGPFKLVRLAGDTLQVQEQDGTMNEEFATFDQRTGLWWTNRVGPAEYDAWTDVTIFGKEK
jgi:hypothetical protein